MVLRCAKQFAFGGLELRRQKSTGRGFAFERGRETFCSVLRVATETQSRTSVPVAAIRTSDSARWIDGLLDPRIVFVRKVERATRDRVSLTSPNV